MKKMSNCLLVTFLLLLVASSVNATTITETFTLTYDDINTVWGHEGPGLHSILSSDPIELFTVTYEQNGTSMISYSYSDGTQITSQITDNPNYTFLSDATYLLSDEIEGYLLSFGVSETDHIYRSWVHGYHNTYNNKDYIDYYYSIGLATMRAIINITDGTYIGDLMISGSSVSPDYTVYYGFDLSKTTASPSAPTPEPTTMILFGFGLLSFTGMVRKRKFEKS